MITIKSPNTIEPVQCSQQDGKLIVMVDASVISVSSCLLRMFYIAVEGYHGGLNSNDIEFGTAFHKMRAVFREFGYDEGYRRGLKEAKEYYENTPMAYKSRKKYLTTEFLITGCISYLEKYKKDTFDPIVVDGHTLVEQKFAIPYYCDDTLEIILCGTCDEIGKWRSGIYAIADLKTTASWNQEEYLDSYKASPQMMFYRWAIKQYAVAYPDSIFAKIDAEDCAVFIDGVFHKGASSPIEFQRSNMFMFKEHQIQRFDRMLKDKLGELIMAIKRWQDCGEHPWPEGLLNGACGTKFGLCQFANACTATDDEVRAAVLSHFKKRHYNPLTFQL